MKTPEQTKRYFQAYYRKNKKKYLERARTWRIKNKPRFDEYHREWREQNREKINEQATVRIRNKRKKRLCVQCSGPSKKYRCERCSRAYAGLRKQFYDRAKEKVLAHYGAACICCGETELRFLTVDHVNNDGATDRKQNGRLGGKNLCAAIVARKYPSSYQIMCFNCNCGRALNGGLCPHKTRAA